MRGPPDLYLQRRSPSGRTVQKSCSSSLWHAADELDAVLLQPLPRSRPEALALKCEPPLAFSEMRCQGVLEPANGRRPFRATSSRLRRLASRTVAANSSIHPYSTDGGSGSIGTSRPSASPSSMASDDGVFPSRVQRITSPVSRSRK